jgi:hypothetical protein
VSRLATLIVLTAAVLARPAEPPAQLVPDPADIVRNILSLPDDQLDYGRAKLAFDQIIDPALNVDAASAEMDQLASQATALPGAGPLPWPGSPPCAG